MSSDEIRHSSMLTNHRKRDQDAMSATSNNPLMSHNNEGSESHFRVRPPKSQSLRRHYDVITSDKKSVTPIIEEESSI